VIRRALPPSRVTAQELGEGGDNDLDLVRVRHDREVITDATGFIAKT
jgi:hypothetical protein